MPESFIESTHSVIIDYSLSFDDMVAAGKYKFIRSWVNADNYPVKGEGTHVREIVLIGFKIAPEIEQVDAEFERLGMRHTVTEENLALGAQYPDLLKIYTMPDFGSNRQRLGNFYSYRAFLSHCNSGRGLGGCDCNLTTMWNQYYRFPAVRK